MQNVYASKELNEFLIEITTKWSLGLGYPEVTIRPDGESSIVALSRRVEEKLREAGVKTMHNTSPAYDSRSAGHAESGVRIVKEKVHTLICFARELDGVWQLGNPFFHFDGV